MKDFSILISPVAQEYFKQQTKENQAIKLKIKKNGCSGYSYVLEYVNKCDNNIIINNLYFDIEDQDKTIINNLLIDIKKDGLNKKIIFNNPQAHNYCGCGESFSIKEIK